jgi:transposase
MVRLAAVRIVLRRRVRRSLERIARSTRAPHARVVRAQIVLLGAAGRTNAEIARQLGCEVKTVRKWRGRFAARPVIPSLEDEERTGRPPSIPVLARLELVKLACSPLPLSRAPFRQLWTAEALRDALRRTTRFVMSVTEVRRTLRDEEIRPHRMRVWLHSPDPEFAPKVRRICNLYRATPAPDEVVLCVDEKTGMQALQRKHPSKPPSVGRAGRYEFEYLRRGTRTLIAAFNPHTGEIFGRCFRRRRACDLMRFMKAVAQRYPRKRITIVWDNLNIHAGAPWDAFNRRHGSRFRFVYTPIHASWVNQVEIWFSILARRVLRYSSFATATELTCAVRSFIARWNKHERHPFRWTFRGDFRRAAA